MRQLAVVALVIAVAGCRGDYVFDCGKNSFRCLRDGKTGICEVSPTNASHSYCVFDSPLCVGGEGQWDATAGDGLAGRCLASGVVGTGGLNLAGCMTSVDLNAVWGASLDDVWVVGDNSTIFYYSGTTGCSQESNGVPAGLTLRAVWGRNATDVFVAGDGVILHSTDHGMSWMNGDQPAASQYWGVSGNANFTFAGVEKTDTTEGGKLYQSTNDGTNWLLVSNVPADGDPLATVWSDGNTVWIGGGSTSPYYTVDGMTWNGVDAGSFPGYISAFGTNSKGVLAFTTGSVIMRNVGSSWNKLFNHGNGGACGNGFNAASVLVGSAIAVGKAGCIAGSTDDGDTWVASDSYGPSQWPYTMDFNGVWTDPQSGHTVVVGAAGTVILDPTLPQ